jgi:soluble lytic murein transglycosylase-like protein
VVDHIFAAGQTDSLAQLDQLTVQQTDLDQLRAEHVAERQAVEELEARLAEETETLQEVFAEADASLAAAYQRAAAADAAYRAALSDVDRARAAQEAQRQQEQAATTTTQPGAEPPPDTTAPGEATTTTTTSPPSDSPSRPIRPEVERWRSTVAAHFPANRVNEALLIIQCESLGDPEAVNPYSGASGLFQFMPGTWAVASVSAGVGDASVFDAVANTTAAAWLGGYYESRGLGFWDPWTCRYYL